MKFRFFLAALCSVLFLSSARSHEDHHDEHHIHDDDHTHAGDHSNQGSQLSKLMRDLERYCLGKIHDDKTDDNRTSDSLNNNGDINDSKDNGVNFTKTFCEPVLNVMRLSAHRTTTELQQEKSMPPSTWGYAFLACIIISLVGLLAVAVIPLMHKVIYNHLLQFLVSLAIGSLAGDALLHLIPHALVPHDHHHHHHHEHEFHDLQFDLGGHGQHKGHDRRPVWLGLMALGGLFVFFIVERLVGYCSEAKRKRNKGDKYPTPPVNRPPEVHELKTAGDSTVNGMMVDAGGDRKDIGGGGVGRTASNGSASCEQMLMVVHASKDIKKMAFDAHEEMHKNCDTPAVDQVNMIHSRGGHHHHSHDVPGSVAAVAWMVIVGDGFHNFADGIAIGSAFASSIQDGLSTTIAIFCHELPHELGDFAMLLSAGMSGKQALVYNCVSSVLCLVGMCVGVGMSNLVAATPWIFMAIAGMFIYIALVDMLPEMKSVDPKRGEHPLLHLGLQVMGMLTGCSVMLIIALFEHQITIPM